MQMLRRGPLAVAYWVVAFVASVLAGVVGAHLGRDAAPQFSEVDEGAAATSGARFLFGVLGFVVGSAAVAAVFAGFWLLAWVHERRSAPSVDAAEEEQRGDMDELLVDEDGTTFEDLGDLGDAGGRR